MKHVYQLADDTTLKDAIEELDRGGAGFLAFIDQAGVFVGILTDGDIRRAVLKNEKDLNAIINRQPITMSYKATKQAIVAKLKRIHRRHMPLLDEDGRLFRVFLLDDIHYVTRPNPVVIMAGGLGQRLGELTKDKPKPLLHVGEKPILQHIIEQFRDFGFYTFILCLNYKNEAIQTFFGDGALLGVSIKYIVEDTRLGTAGALSLVKHHLNDQSFFVINADILSNVDMLELMDAHCVSGADATMCVRNHEYHVPFGVIKANGHNQICSIEEKPTLTFEINAGIYVMSPHCLTYVGENQYLDMPDLFSQLVHEGFDCRTKRIDDYWIDIGVEPQLKKADMDLAPYK